MLLRRELAVAFKQKSELLQPLMFCVLVVSLFPIGIGPGPAVLQKVGGGIIWVTAILSSLLGMERLFRDDFQQGWLEQVLLSGSSVSLIMMIKIGVHWVNTLLPLLILSPLLALFLNFTLPMYVALVLTLIIGTPVLSLTGAIASALTVGVNKSAVLVPLLLLPVFIPLLIFATSTVEAAALQLAYRGQLAIIGAMTMFTLVFAPYTTAYAIRVSQG